MRHIDSSEGLCVFCGAGSRETTAHVLVECSEWRQLRASLLASLIRQASQLLHGHAPRLRATPTNVSCLLLGGAASGVCSERHTVHCVECHCVCVFTDGIQGTLLK
jgi:hypothetical protein